MGRHRFFTSGLTLMVWMASTMASPAGPALPLYLPEDTFIIRDTRFISPEAPVIPVNTPLLQTGIGPQRSLIPSIPTRQLAGGPLRSFQPSRSSQEPTYFIPQRSFLPVVDTPLQDANFVPQNAFVTVDSHQQPTDFALQNPSQQQPDHIPQIPFEPLSTTQQHSAFAPQRPYVPTQAPSSRPTNPLRSATTTRRPSRVSQGHRFSSTMRPTESQRQPVSENNIPLNHRKPFDNGYRQTSKPQENTNRRPSNRHYLCGVMPTSGDCRAAFPRYYYNNQTDQCDCFLYGGCGSEGLKYSYQTLEECHSTCSPSKLEEGSTCKEIFHQEDVFHHTPAHNLPRPVPSPNHNLPRPLPVPEQRYPPVDTSHIPDEPFLILLVNSAAHGNRDAYNTDFETNERRYK